MKSADITNHSAQKYLFTEIFQLSKYHMFLKVPFSQIEIGQNGNLQILKFSIFLKFENFIKIYVIDTQLKTFQLGISSFWGIVS